MYYVRRLCSYLCLLSCSVGACISLLILFRFLCIWCIAEWPDHILQRSICWATLTLVRCAIVDQIKGGLSHVFARLLPLFNSLQGGVMLPGNGDPLLFRATFAGVLADLVGHQSLTAWKGPNAVRACIFCANLSARLKGPGAHEVGLKDHDERLWISCTSDEVYLIVDRLKHLCSVGISKGKLADLSTELGFNHDPDGILLDVGMRNLFRPVEHQIIDWMHTWCQDGVANVEVAMLLRSMEQLRPSISNDMVQTFLNTCVLPSAYGKINGNWVEPRRLKNGTLTAFASMLLSLVPCLYLFLDLYGVKTYLPDEYECFKMMHHIIGLLRLGPSVADTHCDVLRLWTIEHHRLFTKLYPDKVGRIIRADVLMPVSCIHCGRRIVSRTFLCVARSNPNYIIRIMWCRLWNAWAVCWRAS